MKIGHRIKELRQKMNMTRKSFSEATGISVSYLSEVERDLKRPAVDIILKISNAFNISVADIIGDSLVTPLNPEMKDLVETLGILNLTG